MQDIGALVNPMGIAIDDEEAQKVFVEKARSVKLRFIGLRYGW
jgi:hypothetical protein